jgi:hypothetical protein
MKTRVARLVKINGRGWSLAAVLAVLMVCCTFRLECAELVPITAARIIKIVLTDGKQPRMFSKQTEIVGWNSITNQFSSNTFKMTSRDFVIVQYDYSDLSRKDKDSLGFVVLSCEKVKAQLHYNSTRESRIDIRSAMVVHYVTPYDNPRDQSSTDYFVNERFVGKSNDGFDAALKAVRSRNPSAVVWIGSRYEHGGSWSPNERPYLDRLGELYAILDGAKIRLVLLDFHQFDLFPNFVP